MGKRPSRRIAQLWQLPLLLLSLALFTVAAYLFIDPKPGLTIDEKIALAGEVLKKERPTAAIDKLNALLNSEKMDAVHEGRVHLLLAEALAAAQKEKGLNLLQNHENIIQQTRMAVALGAKLEAPAYRRLGESYEAIERPADAIINWRQAMALEPAKALALLKKIIELQINHEDRAAAAVSLEEYLGNQDLSHGERAWALGETAHVLIDKQNFTEARQRLEEAQKLSNNDPAQQGHAHYWMGYCALKLGEYEEAERYLRSARNQLKSQHPLDGDAAYYLGTIADRKKNYAEANAFYESVLTNHPGSKLALLARLNRGVNRIVLDQDDAGLTDMHDLCGAVGDQESSKARFRPQVVEALRASIEVLNAKSNYVGAIELLEYEQRLEPDPQPAFFSRLANTYEKRAEQLEKTAGEAKPADQPRREQQVREMRAKAGDAFIAYSRAMTLKDDVHYGSALWKGIQLYNRAGDMPRVISALELFVSERPTDPLTPEALLQLGQAYQAAGAFDKAIAVYQRNQFTFPTSLGALKSAVPLALAYLSKGPEFHSKAETVLKNVLQSEVLTPEAQEFRQALIELSQLYYRNARFEEAVARLEEVTQRYPTDARMPQFHFLMADSYRKSAALLSTQMASAQKDDALQASINLGEAVKARKERLQRARLQFDKAIEMYRATQPETDVDKLYFKLAHFYRADCEFDLGNFAESIKLYDAAAFRYQDDPSALAAYVQIVNANCALGKMDEARAANERAKWLLHKMPGESFSGGGFAMPKEYWEKWLKWSGETGIWK